MQHGQLTGNQDLESAWRRFEVHVDFMFPGPLKEKSEEERCSYLMLWVGEKGRNIFSTGTIKAGKEKLATYFNGFKEYVKPMSNTVYNRFLFQRRTQKADESFYQFYTELKGPCMKSYSICLDFTRLCLGACIINNCIFLCLT